MSTQVLVTTGAGNVIKGGADIWTNHFLKEVWPKLPKRRSWLLLIDSKRPLDFNPKSLPEKLIYHFHGDDPQKTKEWLSKASKIHFLHSHYHKRPHIFFYEDKFDTIFVHANPREMMDVIKEIPEINRHQLNTKVDVDFYEDFLWSFKKLVWVGCNKTKLKETHPNYFFNIPNFYEFKINAKLSNHFSNRKVAYAARIETRKLFHWMKSQKGPILVDQKDFKNIKDLTDWSFSGLDLYQWDPDIHSHFMAKNWGIFHGAHLKEPFGYNIFQAVDWGKIPIINKDWCPELNYKYRAGTINDFEKMVGKIAKDSQEVRLEEFNKIKSFMKKFDNKQEWVKKITQALTDTKYDMLDAYSKI